LGNSALLVFFLETVTDISNAITVDNSSDLEVLGKVIGVIVLVEAFRENLVSKLDRFQVIL
jgi:hypothetical protein